MEQSRSGLALRKSVIYKKCVALILVVFLVIVAILVVRHFFYILDSYYYTAEFHVMFMKHNLRTGNVELFTEYFKSLKNIAGVFPMLLGAYVVQDYWLPFSKPILVPAVISAFGIKEGMALGYLSFILVGLISFGIGIFFLGDILFIFQQRMLWGNIRWSAKYLAGGLIGVLFAFPLVPIVLPATLGAVVRMPLKRITVITSAAFVIRLGLLVSARGVFT